VDVLADRFSVALIPHTMAMTTLGFKQIGAAVNFENRSAGEIRLEGVASHAVPFGVRA